MEKDFNSWNILKQNIDSERNRPSFKQREIWWCHIGLNIGDEENGKGKSYQRPVLVLRKFNNHIFFAVPLTTRVKDNPLYHKIHFKGKDQCAMLSQAKTLESKRIINKMGKITTEEFKKLKESFKNVF